MAKTTSPRKPRTTRLRQGSGEAGSTAATKTATAKAVATKAPATPKKLPKAIQAVVDAARDKKATGIVVLDLKKAGAFTDYFVICSGANPRQVQAIADSVEESLKAQKQRPSLVEGHARAEWILLDYFDFVVHVFSRHARDFYGLDRLWGSAIRTEFPDED
jgi:ribosome-associated protein